MTIIVQPIQATKREGRALVLTRTHLASVQDGFIEVLNFEQSGWDQQMSYTWFSDRWILPAPYYKTSVVYKEGN